MWLFPYWLVAIGGFGSIQSSKLIEWYTNGHAFWVLPLLTLVLLVSFDQLKHYFKVLWHSINHLCVFSMLGLLLVPYHCIVILNSFNSSIPCKDSHSQNLSIPFRIADEFASSFSLLFSYLFQHSFSLFVCSEILVLLELASMCNKLDLLLMLGHCQSIFYAHLFLWLMPKDNEFSVILLLKSHCPFIHLCTPISFQNHCSCSPPHVLCLFCRSLPNPHCSWSLFTIPVHTPRVSLDPLHIACNS